MGRTQFALLSTFAITMSACSGPPVGAPRESIDRSASELVAGKPSDIEGKGPPVFVRTGCGGTLIAPNLVLTARHCVAKYEGSSFACDPRNPLGETGLNAKYYDTIPIRLKRADPEAAAYVIKIYALADQDFCDGDIVVLQLDRDLEGVQIGKLHLYDELNPLELGEELTVHGWGALDTKGTVTNILYEQDVKLLALGPAFYKRDPHPVTVVPDKQLMISGGPCSGDSGSPVSRKSTGAVVSVVSRLRAIDLRLYELREPTNPYPHCHVDLGVSIGPAVHNYKNLIMTAFNAVGHEPLLEAKPEEPPAPTPLGGACGETAECEGGLLCAVVAGSGVCSMDCAADPNICSEDTMCVTSGEHRVCVQTEISGGDGSSSCGVSRGAVSSGSEKWSAWLLAVLLAIAIRRRRSDA